MTHVDDETLALLALGEDADGAARRHVEDCAVCAAELASLRAVVDAGRAGGPLVEPPAGLWDRIAAEVAQQAEPTAPVPDAAPPATPPAAPGPSTRQRARTSRLVWTTAAGVAVGVAGTLLVQGLAQQAAPDVLARADLEPLPGWSETGTAAVTEADGRRVLEVELGGDAPDGYREVWLLDADAERLLSLGPLTGDTARFELPAALDLGEFVVVDVSREPFDGDPTHSGDSIVRGRLT